MTQIIVVAPHPDDETLGCGGTLLKHKSAGNAIHWLIVTEMQQEIGYSLEQIRKREKEIEEVTRKYGFDSMHSLKLPTVHLDTVPMATLISKMGKIFEKIKPIEVYLPYRGDVHTDHSVVFDAVSALSKWFRYPSVKKLLAYETLSETEFGINPDIPVFRPNVFVDITGFLEKKIEIMKCYSGEMKDFPFPRSAEAIEALAKFRGSTIGTKSAEAFMLLKEIQ